MGRKMNRDFKKALEHDDVKSAADEMVDLDQDAAA